MEAEGAAGGERGEGRGTQQGRGEGGERDQVRAGGTQQGRRAGGERATLATRNLGRLGEQLAAEHLIRRGFAILQRNYRTRWGEIDLVALDGRTLVFCEVKSRRCSSRSGPGLAQSGPFESLHRRKRAQVRKMAASWMSEQFERPYAPNLRFDAIGVSFDGRGQLIKLEHLEGAF